MLKIVTAIGVITLALFVVLSFFNSTKADKKLAALGEDIRIHTEQISLLTKENKELTNANTKLIADIGELRKETAENTLAINKGFKEGKELAENRPEYPDECIPVVNYMKAEIDKWMENFSLAIKDRDTWVGIAGKFELAYNNQSQIISNMQLSTDMIVSDSLKKDEIIKDLKKQITLSKVQKTLLGGGMVAVLVTAIVFGIFK